jgi:hypothetical protein
MNTWADLRELRAQGLKPSLPVVISSDGRPPAHMLAEEGCLVIRHNAGEMFHVELLEGLRVIAFLGTCNRAQAVVKLMNARGVQPEEFRAWCDCQKRLDSMPVDCEVVKSWQ